MSGIETLSDNQLFKTSEYLTEGNLYDLDKRSDGIILGTSLAGNIGVNTGDNVSVTTADGISKSFKVIGLFETGAIGVDKTKALVSTQTATVQTHGLQGRTLEERQRPARFGQCP